jgi:hypothetical protein
MTYTNCKTEGCEHHAPKGKLCRYCRGRVEDAALVAERKRKAVATMKGRKINPAKLRAALRPPLRAFLVTVKKSKPVATPAPTLPNVTLITAERVKVGTVISLHGTVEKIEPMVGRALWMRGKKYKYVEAGKPASKNYKLVGDHLHGFLFTTDQGEYFYMESAAVPTL